MQTLESIRSKIESASDLLSVVKTMKAMAAVNIRQCEDAVRALADYDRIIQMGLQIVLRDAMPEIRLAAEPSDRRLGAVVFGSKQGMVGQFNERMADHALQELDRLGIEREQRAILATGLLSARLEDAGQPVEEELPAPWSVPHITSLVHRMLVRVDEWRSRQRIDHIVLFYNQSGPGASYHPTTVRLLPMDPHLLQTLRKKQWPGKTIPTFTMDWRELFAALIRQYVSIALYRAYAESLASENAHRLTSMQAAEKNIEERLDGLSAHYHRMRQSSITEELRDIISGFEALGDSDGANRLL